jgi:hypothetical protein
MVWRPSRIERVSFPSSLVADHADDVDLNLSFEPSPDYPGIAAAAGDAWGATVTKTDKVDSTLQDAVKIVQGGRCAVVEVR